MIARLLTWLRGLASRRPETTDEQMDVLRRELERRLAEHRGDDHG